MDSITKFFVSTIENLNQEDFNSLVALYQNDIMGNKYIVNCDGTGDGGNDIKVYSNGYFRNRSVQITVQRNIDSKIREDLEKVQKNIREYGYSEIFEFFWSHSVSESKLNEYRQIAKGEYQIELHFFDAKILASAKSDRISDFLYSIHHVKPQDRDKIDSRSKVLFDILSHGANTSDIKNNIIDSAIVFYVNSRTTVEQSEICSYIKETINPLISKEVVVQRINVLKSAQRLVPNAYNNKKVVLSPEESNIVSNIIKQTEIIQAEFESSFHSILSKYAQQDKYDNYFNFLLRLYESYYEFNIDEASTNIDYNDSSIKVFEDFRKFVKRNLNDDILTDELIRDIKQLCSGNDYINKICITTSFTSLYSSNKLDYYLSNTTKDIYLDTPLLVFCLCKYYLEEDADWEDINYKSTSELLDACECNSKVSLFTTYEYIREAAGELQKALNISYFLDYDFFSNLGEIKNSFIKYYLYLKANQLLGEGVDDFMGFVYDLGFDNLDPSSPDFINDTSRMMANFLQEYGVDIKNHKEFYPDLDSFVREYDIQLSDPFRNKSRTAKINDVKTFIMLAGKDTEDYNNKIFATWDVSLYKFRETILKKYHERYDYFQIYNPARLLNKIGLEQFRTTPSSISNDIFVYADINFNLTNKVKSLIESIAPILGKNVKKSHKFVKALSEIRQKELHTNQTENVTPAQLPLEDILLGIIAHYKSNNLTGFTAILIVEEYAMQVLKVLDDSVKALTVSKKSKQDVISCAIQSIGVIIEEYKETLA